MHVGRLGALTAVLRWLIPGKYLASCFLSETTPRRAPIGPAAPALCCDGLRSPGGEAGRWHWLLSAYGFPACCWCSRGPISLHRVHTAVHTHSFSPSFQRTITYFLINLKGVVQVREPSHWMWLGSNNVGWWFFTVIYTACCDCFLCSCFYFDIEEPQLWHRRRESLQRRTHDNDEAATEAFVSNTRCISDH